MAALNGLDSLIEFTKDCVAVPASYITNKIDNLCQEKLGLGLMEMSATLYAGGLTAPLGVWLESVSTWAKVTSAGTGSTVVMTATNVGVEVVNQAAGLVGINGNSVKLNAGQQGKHIKGHNNYIPGKSVLYGNLDDAQELLNKYAGTGQKINESKERVNFGKVIGTYINQETGEILETTNGIIHYGTNGAHIIPSRP